MNMLHKYDSWISLEASSDMKMGRHRTRRRNQVRKDTKKDSRKKVDTDALKTIHPGRNISG
jgi:hypothetical protein